MDPVINKYREMHNQIEYDLVAAEGIVGAAESVSSIGKEKPAAFVKVCIHWISQVIRVVMS